jgi:hypothetical protein
MHFSENLVIGLKSANEVGFHVFRISPALKFRINEQFQTAFYPRLESLRLAEEGDVRVEELLGSFSKRSRVPWGSWYK